LDKEKESVMEKYFIAMLAGPSGGPSARTSGHSNSQPINSGLKATYQEAVEWARTTLQEKPQLMKFVVMEAHCLVETAAPPPPEVTTTVLKHKLDPAAARAEFAEAKQTHPAPSSIASTMRNQIEDRHGFEKNGFDANRISQASGQSNNCEQEEGA
jgi:hypothetical protein